MSIDRFLDGVDLLGIHSILAIIGALLCVYVMQLTHHETEDAVDPWIVRKIRRIALALLALSLCWSVTYSYAHAWQPWPPELALIAAINLTLMIRIAAIWARIRRTGHHCWNRDLMAESKSQSLS